MKILLQVPHQHWRSMWVARVFAACIVILSATIFLGWVTDIRTIKFGFGLPGHITTKANTAIALMCVGVALGFATLHSPPKLIRLARGILPLVAIAIGIATGLQDLVHTNFGIDEFLAPDDSLYSTTGAAGRMSPLTAASLVLAGVSLMMLRLKSAVSAGIAQFFAWVVVLISGAALVGYTYNTAALFQMKPFTAIPSPTAVQMVLLGLAIMLASHDRGIMAAFSTPSISGRIWRRLLSAAIVIPILLGGLKLTGYRLELFDHATGTGLVAIGNIFVSSVVIAWMAVWVYKAEVSRLHAEADLREQHERLKTTLASIGDAVIATDVNGRIEFINPVAANLTGWSADAAAGRNLPDVFRIVAEATRESVESPVGKVLRDGAVVGLANHTLLIARDGREIPIDDSAAPIRLPTATGEMAMVGVILVFRDVTMRRAAERAMAEREQALRQLADSMPQIVFAMNPEGNLMYVNRRWAAFAGLPPGEIHTDREVKLRETLIHPDDLKLTRDRWATALQAKGEFDVEHRLRRHDGEFRWHLTRALPVCDEAGHVLRWYGTSTDIHDQKLVQTELAELSQTLEQRVTDRTAAVARRTEQLRALAIELTQTEQRERRRIAENLHDHLQQLLVAAKMRVDRVRRANTLDAVRDLVGEIDGLLADSIASSRSLTSQLSPPILHDGGLAPALDWLARQVQREHGIEVSVTIDPRIHDANIETDVRDFLFQATREMLFNVVKHADAKTAVVTARFIDENLVGIEVADNGRGFDMSQLASGSDATGGFGLFNIQQRAEFLGGSLRIDTAPGEGCRVEIRLPVVIRPVKPATAASSETVVRTAPAIKTKRCRVLLADDHQVLREALAEMLRMEPDIELIGEAADGHQAVNLVRALKPDVVVMDITMPVLNGIEATRQIKREFPDIAVIGLSMHDSEDMITALREAGAVNYVTKGGATQDLLAAIRAARCA